MMKNEFIRDESSINLKEIKDKYRRENRTNHEGINKKYKIKEKHNEQKENNKRLIYIKDIYGDINVQKKFGEIINKEKANKIKPKLLLSEKNIISIEKIKLENDSISIIKNSKVINENIPVITILNIYLFLLQILFSSPLVYLNITLSLNINQIQFIIKTGIYSSYFEKNKEHILLHIIFIINFICRIMRIEEKRREEKRREEKRREEKLLLFHGEGAAKLSTLPRKWPF